MPAIYAYLDCGIPENGVARVRCECGEDFFVAFSCKKRMICPSCSTKRSILFGEKVREIVKPFPHLHVTFTIPKILRGYFRRNRKLLKLLTQSANFAIKQYFHETLSIKDGYTGGELLSKVVFELKIKRQSGFQESPRFHQRIVHLQSPLPGNQSHVTFSNSFLRIVPA